MKDRDTRFQKFSVTLQPPLKLQLALEGFADPEEMAEHRSQYAAYLRKRRRPAAAELARQGETGRLRQLLEEGILSLPEMEGVMRETVKQGNTTAWLCLVSARAAVMGMQEKSGSPHTAGECIRRCRSLIWSGYPYLSKVLALLEPAADEACENMGTDGKYLYYHPEQILREWEIDPSRVLRLYLHTLLHCIWFHIWEIDPADMQACQKADEQTEKIIRRETKHCPALQGKSGDGDEPPLCDDHHYWPGPEMPGQKRVRGSREHHKEREQWKRLAEEAGKAASGSGAGVGIGSDGYGLLPGQAVLQLERIEKSRSDYRKFLSSFTVWKEMQELDPDHFDYIYYHMGMEQFDRTPLIEPLEYREGHKLEQLVIAIDTSGSVKDETVRRFLEETYAILDEKENFFDRMEVWILQCDLVVEHAEKITCRRDWELYAEKLQIIGRAGTDFRPVFQWIEKKQQTGELRELKALLYFTDGDGIYPSETPSYQAAFLHVNQADGFAHAPKWVRVLSVEQFR